MEFKERLRDLQLKKHMKSKEVAQLAGISDHTYISYENSKNQPSYDVLCKMADILGVTTDMLLGRKYAERIDKDGWPNKSNSVCREVHI